MQDQIKTSTKTANEVNLKNSKKTGGEASKKKDDATYSAGTNWVVGGIEENSALFSLAVAAPFLTCLFGYLTSIEFQSTGI